MKQRAFDVLGNVAIVNFPWKEKASEKKKFANRLLKQNNAIKTVLEKVGKVKGRLRKPTINYVAGEKTKEVLYKENDCVFRFNVDTTYFSPRLSNERKEIADLVKKGENVLVMFAGVGPFPIVVAKNSDAGKVVSVEINREANKYAKLNVGLNNLKNKVEILQGDVKKIKLKDKYDVIIMPRPRLKDTFLPQAFKLSKKGTRIFYYDFCDEKDVELIVEKIKKEARQSRRKIKILKKKKAGEIAPYKIRLRVDFRVL